jgi:hypothetical protein
MLIVGLAGFAASAVLPTGGLVRGLLAASVWRSDACQPQFRGCYRSPL